MEEFNLQETNKGDISILYLDGFLDAHTSSELEKAFEKLISEKRHNVVVNFQKLSYISSAGLGVFMAYIETNYSGKQILISSHGVAIGLLRRILEGRELGATIDDRELKPPHCKLMIYTGREDNYTFSKEI